MLLSLSIVGIFLSLILLFFNAGKNRSTLYLGLVFLLIGLYAFYQYILVYSKSVEMVGVLLTGFIFFFPPLYLIGPMLFWYIRSVLTDHSSLKRSDLWHLIPMVIYFLFSLPYSFVPISEKIDTAREVVANVGIIQGYTATGLSRIFSVQAIYLSRPLLLLIYTIGTGFLLARYVLRKRLSGVFSGQHFMLIWLSHLLGFLFVLTISHILLIVKVFTMNFSQLFFTLNILRIISSAGMIGLLVSPFFFPAILYGLPRIPEVKNTGDPTKGQADSGIREEKKATLRLESEYIQSIARKTDACMIEFQPYLQPEFNLTKLSILIDIPMHHLSYYFREIKKQHFMDYRNEWRIRHAKELIRKGKIRDLTIEAIAELSGFTNRNSFSTTFQRIEGITPSVFASRVKE